MLSLILATFWEEPMSSWKICGLITVACLLIVLLAGCGTTRDLPTNARQVQVVAQTPVWVNQVEDPQNNDLVCPRISRDEVECVSVSERAKKEIERRQTEKLLPFVGGSLYPDGLAPCNIAQGCGGGYGYGFGGDAPPSVQIGCSPPRPCAIPGGFG